MSKKRDTINPEIETLDQEDVVDEYGRLAESYKSVKSELDAKKQKIHQASQINSTLQATQGELQYELEQIHNTHKQEINKIERENSSIIEHLRLNISGLSTEKIQLEVAIENLKEKLLESQGKCEELKANQIRVLPRVSDSFASNWELELDNLREIHKDKEESFLREIQQKQNMIDELSENVACLEDNLCTKQLMIEEKNDTIEQMQEKNQELMIEIATLKTAPEKANGKGNSLFAEVDDQRQQLKKILTSERLHFNEMKRIVNAKEMENRRLKRENMNIKTEIQTCTELLRRGEQIATESISTLASQLQNENKELKSSIASLQRNIVDLAKEQKLEWVAAIASKAAEDARETKEKFLQLMLEKTSLADSLNKSYKDLSKSRVDCVKYKQLLSRVIEANNVNLKRQDVYEIGFNEEVYASLAIEEFEKLEESEEAPSSSQCKELGGSAIEEDDEVPTIAETIDEAAAMAEEKVDSTVEGVHPARGKENRAMSSCKDAKTDLVKPFGESQSPKTTPSKPLQTPNRSKEEKSVKFSSAVKTDFIDSTKEQYEQSKQARARSKVIVQRIRIPSKAPSKSSEPN